MAYPETAATMIDLISQKLQDTGNATWTDAEIILYLPEGLREISQKSPHMRMQEFLIESRRGTATSTVSGRLVDATNDQFVSTAFDVGKIVYNNTDRTWAYIKTYVDSENVTISKNIMASGEGYRIYNKNCNHHKEIYLGEMPDWLWIDKIEFPTMLDPPNYVKWIQRGKDVIRLDTDIEPDNTKYSIARKQVWIYFALRHKLSQLTDLSVRSVAAVEGATSIGLTQTQVSTTIEMGQEFTIANERGVYIITANATTSAGQTATIYFWPPLESSVDTNEVITFLPSTLTPKLEGIFAGLMVGKCLMHKANKYPNQITKGGTNVWSRMYTLGKAQYDAAIDELEGLTGYAAPCVALP